MARAPRQKAEKRANYRSHLISTSVWSEKFPERFRQWAIPEISTTLEKAYADVHRDCGQRISGVLMISNMKGFRFRLESFHESGSSTSDAC
uniref:Uncharacterized protein n=1 Tax=Cucumis melo TaxID=3656 RepID=A0A9I9E6W4_CUCME